MSEVQTNDHDDGGGKNKQKKQTLRVDFTPMVDMNMLLITFFMFCTTLLKPQTMNINMPTKDKPKEEEGTQVADSRAVTLLLGADNELYYYEGKIQEASYENPEFLKSSTYGAEGIRELLLKKNEGTYEKIQELKLQLQHAQIADSTFRQKVKEIQEEANKPVGGIAPTIMIKPTDQSTYKNMVDALDEMLVCNIGAYAIMDLSLGDRHLLYKKTDNEAYLTEGQLKEMKGSSGK
ncbi:MAG: biopolymer transporter ExbD [Dysgonamonadaceae bacterium]|jgi:biopolymer transport protein ExbD|nr:biopolymer transporter ExbD [Dysgonamonadaceae bacterium]